MLADVGSRTSLAPIILTRYGHIMPNSPANLPDAVLRLWLLAEIAMAGLYVWQGWLLWPYPGDWAPPPPRRSVAVVEGLYLFLFIPAAWIIAVRWRGSRDRRLAMLGLAYGLLTGASFAAWAMAASLGTVRGLCFADALIALVGVATAQRGIRAQA